LGYVVAKAGNQQTSEKVHSGVPQRAEATAAL
jgi:hypothetical protein